MSLEALKGKKLLILAGAGVHSKVVRAAKEMGVYTIVTDYLPDSPAKLLADEAWMYSITDVDAIVARCREEKVDGVLNFCIDPGQIPYQKICEQLGLPCYGTKEQFDILTDKRKFKDYCIAHNVDVIPDYTEEDILKDRAEYPVFIKPTNSRGSRGQSICYNKEEALAGLAFAKKESSTGGAVCEKYLEGKQDMGTAWFVVDGEPYLVKLADRHLGKKEDNLDKQVICTKLPSTFAPTFMEKVALRAKEMIRALGVKFGPVFMQGFIDGDTVRFYDPAMRMPGGDYDLVLREATGFDTVKSLIHYALTGDCSTCVGNPENAYMLNGGTALLITFSVKPGKMARVEGFEEIQKNPYVVYARQIILEGAIIPDSGDIGQRVAAIGAYVPEKKDIPAYVKTVYQTCRILDEQGNDMVLSRYVYKGEQEELA